MKPLISLFIVAALAACASNEVAQTNSQGARTETCKATAEAEIASLFDRWNQSLQTGDPNRVVANYAVAAEITDWAGCFFVLTENKIRIKRPRRLMPCFSTSCSMSSNWRTRSHERTSCLRPARSQPRCADLHCQSLQRRMVRNSRDSAPG